MKAFTCIFCIFLHLYCARSLKCFDCFIDGPFPFYFLRPFGPVWSRCSGVQDDYIYCDGGVCTEFMLYGSDISKYQILRSCAFSPEVCNILEISNNVHVGKCRTCKTDNCNNVFDVAAPGMMTKICDAWNNGYAGLKKGVIFWEMYQGRPHTQ